VSAHEIVAAIDAEMPLERLPERYRGEVAGRWRYAGATDDAEVGVIASVSQPFCGDCTRARISAEGKLYTCLFSAVGHDLRAVARDAAATDLDLREAIARVWRIRDDRYSDLRTEATSDLPRIEMFAMGG